MQTQEHKKKEARLVHDQQRWTVLKNLSQEWSLQSMECWSQGQGWKATLPRNETKKTVKVCKMTWLNYITKCATYAHMLNANGGDTWKVIEEIVAGINGHHRQLTASKLKWQTRKTCKEWQGNCQHLWRILCRSLQLQWHATSAKCTIPGVTCLALCSHLFMYKFPRILNLSTF